MTDTDSFTPRPLTRKSASRAIQLPSLRRDEKSFEKAVEHSNFQYLLAVRERYETERWKWTSGARFLFTCLIHALDLEDHERFILRVAEPRRGAKKKQFLAERIWYEKDQGKNIPQIRAALEASGSKLSADAVREYLKKRRRQ